jgi:hypothetical protein
MKLAKTKSMQCFCASSSNRLLIPDLLVGEPRTTSPRYFTLTKTCASKLKEAAHCAFDAYKGLDDGGPFIPKVLHAEFVMEMRVRGCLDQFVPGHVERPLTPEVHLQKAHSGGAFKQFGNHTRTRTPLSMTAQNRFSSVWSPQVWIVHRMNLFFLAAFSVMEPLRIQASHMKR